MKMLKVAAGLFLFVCLLWPAGRVFGQESLAFYRSEPARDNEVAAALVRKLPKGPRAPVSIAILEKIADKPSPQLFAETTLHYYLDSCGFPVKDGESALLREYAGFYFADRPRDFPLTMTAKYYIIGTASAEPGNSQVGLAGGKSQLEVRVLDREGFVIFGKKVSVETTALSADAAEVRALKTAASEIAVQVLPLLKY